MNREYREYYDLLRHELIPAYGCTEPCALAYAATVATHILGQFPEKMEVVCSSTIIKNVFSVDIPNANDLKGPRAAAILGALINSPEKKLCVLQSVGPEILVKARELYDSSFCTVRLQPDYDCLYIRVEVECQEDSAEVIIVNEHTNIISAKKNGKTLSHKDLEEVEIPNKDFLTVEGALDFAENCDISEIKEVLESQIANNTKISQEGLRGDYGLCVGKNLISFYGDSNVAVRARAMAAAGSDARMAGCVMPVVINSGSGNQGLTVSLPVIEYAAKLNVSHDKLLRALAFANLVSIRQKRNVGNLSAFCGAVHAAAGAASGICYLLGGSYEDVSNTISYTLGTIGGMICDGAKASCASKINEAIDTALMGMQLSMKKSKYLLHGDGLIKSDVETTINGFGKVGKEGMKETNEVVLNIMLDE